MLNRLVPWRDHPPNELHQLIGYVSSLIFYLVKEYGLLSITLLDEIDHKYKLSIGQIIKCTCSINKNDHCIHTLYILIKLYKMPIEHPLLWQCSYTETEIKQIMQMRTMNNNNNNEYYIKTNEQHISLLNVNNQNENNHFDNLNQYHINNIGLRNNKLRASTVARSKREKNEYNHHRIYRLPLNIDDTCPICLQYMSEDEGITYCHKKCGVNLHIKCCVILIQYLTQEKACILCPICKFEWDSQILEIINYEKYIFDNRLIIHKGHICQGCKNNTNKHMDKISKLIFHSHSLKYLKHTIKGKLFHCLYCENYELCEKCYANYEHYEHNRFLVKETIIGDWIPAKNREKLYSIKNKGQKLINNDLNPNVSLENIEDISISNLDNNESMNNQELIIKNKALEASKYDSSDTWLNRNITIEQYIISCFSYFNPSKGETSPISINTKIAIGGALWATNDRKMCVICRKIPDNPCKLRRLNCGHLASDSCLISYIKSKSNTCPEDNVDFLKGLKLSLCANNFNGKVSNEFKFHSTSKNNNFPSVRNRKIDHFHNNKNSLMNLARINTNTDFGSETSTDFVLSGRGSHRLKKKLVTNDNNISMMNNTNSFNNDSLIKNALNNSDIIHEDMSSRSHSRKVPWTPIINVGYKGQYISKSTLRNNNNIEKHIGGNKSSSLSMIGAKCNLFDRDTSEQSSKNFSRNYQRPYSIGDFKQNRGSNDYTMTSSDFWKTKRSKKSLLKLYILDQNHNKNHFHSKKVEGYNDIKNYSNLMNPALSSTRAQENSPSRTELTPIIGSKQENYLNGIFGVSDMKKSRLITKKRSILHNEIINQRLLVEMKLLEEKEAMKKEVLIGKNSFPTSDKFNKYIESRVYFTSRNIKKKFDPSIIISKDYILGDECSTGIFNTPHKEI